jgi:hypothetical protein
MHPTQPARRRSLAVLGVIVAALAAFPARADEFNLSKEDVAFLQDIAGRDEFTRNLIAMGIGPLREVLAIAPPAPTKVVMTWEQAMIRVWRRANAALDRINKARICDTITEFTSNTKNVRFFFQLYEARGCAD